MKVKDLSELLNKFDDDLEVKVSTVRYYDDFHKAGFENGKSQEVTGVTFGGGVLILRGGEEKRL